MGLFFKEGAITIVLEFMDAGALNDVLAHAGQIPEPQLAWFTRQMLEGLAYMREKHQLHRDIKPSNVCVNTHGNAKLSDFGITSQIESTIEGCDSFVGTYNYMSPERIIGNKYSYSSDIWSLGIVVLECALGQFPYPLSAVAFDMMQNVVHGPVPTVPKDKYSKEFSSFIDSCLNKDPDKRATAKALLGHAWIIEKTKGISQDKMAEWVQKIIKQGKQNSGLAAYNNTTTTSGTKSQFKS